MYSLITNQNQFACFSEENSNYYLSDFKNTDLIVIFSPRREQETIKLYQQIMGVFLIPVLQ